MKRKGERDTYTQLNAEFQRIAWREKKVFLSEKCKEIEENHRLGMIRDLFKKNGHTKGIFHAKIGTIKDKKGKDLIEAEDIKKMWKEYTEELYKKALNDPDNPQWYGHSPKARHPGVQSRVDLRNHYHEQS